MILHNKLVSSRIIYLHKKILHYYADMILYSNIIICKIEMLRCFFNISDKYSLQTCLIQMADQN